MQGHREGEPRQAPITRRAQLIEDVSRPENATPAGTPREQPLREVREGAPGKETPPPAPARGTNARRELRAALSSPQALRRSILLHEVLGPPKAFQS